MEKESQIKFTVTSTTVGKLFDETIDKFFKDKKYLNSISKKDNDPWSPPIGSKKEGGIFGTSNQWSNHPTGGEWLSSSSFSSFASTSSCSSYTNIGSRDAGYWSHQAPATQRVSVIKLTPNSKKEGRKPYFRF